jgi:hypothetical protein
MTSCELLSPVGTVIVEPPDSLEGTVMIAGGGSVGCGGTGVGGGDSAVATRVGAGWSVAQATRAKATKASSSQINARDPDE